VGGAADGGRTPFDFSDVPMNTPFASTPSTPSMPAASPFDPSAASEIGAAPARGAFDLSEEPMIGMPAVSPAPPAAPVDDNPFAINNEPTAPAFGATVTPPPMVGANPPATVPVDDALSRRRREIFDALLPVLGEFAGEIRRSVDYFRSRYPTDSLDQIILCGGSARLPNLDQFLQGDLGVPTVVADPFAGMKVTSRQMSPERLAATAPAFAVAIGLATRDALLGSDKK